MTLQTIIRRTLKVVGALIMIIVFVPYVKEYLFDAPEKEFGIKEGVIISIGFVLAIGGKYWDKIVSDVSNAITKKLSK